MKGSLCLIQAGVFAKACGLLFLYSFSSLSSPTPSPSHPNEFRIFTAGAFCSPLPLHVLPSRCNELVGEGVRWERVATNKLFSSFFAILACGEARSKTEGRRN